MQLERWETDLEGLRRWANDPATWRSEHPVLVLVDVDDVEHREDVSADETWALPFGLPAVVVGISSDRGSRPAACDMVLGPDDGHLIEAVTERAGRNPVAARVLVSLLRTARSRSVEAGLVAESASYSLLQSGREFQRWLASRPRRSVHVEAEPVISRRVDDVLRITLHRPSRRNALDCSMRDALAELLALAIVDTSIRSVVLDGQGDGFCSGGDLDEFGTTPDPASAHLIRFERSLGWMLHRLADRLTVHLHGAAVGSGIELAAFASRVLATQDVIIALPEVSMGLIPGAGGTVSLTNRVGPHRLCRLALTGERLGLATALEWGLVDGELTHRT